jgi:hypothetical protein
MSGIEWCCKNGHVLGLVMENGRGVKHLLLYREAHDLMQQRAQHAAPLQMPDVIAIVRYATDIRCSICGSKKTWMIGRDAIEELGLRLEKLVWRKSQGVVVAKDATIQNTLLRRE